MSRILERIVADMKPALEAAKRNVPFPEMKKRAENARAPKNFVQAFQDRSRTNVIAELKKASPSKGLIRRDFRYMELAHELENAGAAAFSVLTERNYFLGSLDYLREVSAAVAIPVLRKDFIFDAYQIYEARANGADAVLLIAAMLKKEEIREFAKIASGLGMAVLGEAHTEAELEILLNCPEIPLLGINARDLRTFETDLERTYQLIQMIPRDRFPIAESAIRSHEDIARLQGVGAAGFLIGETLMRAEHPGEKLRELIG